MTHVLLNRAMIAPAAISLSLIVGMDQYVVGPLKSRLEQQRSQAALEAQDMARAGETTVTIAELLEQQTEADHRLEQIKRAGEIVRDEGLLFQRISDISAAANVSLERLDPQSTANQAPSKAGTTSLRCSIEAVGSYGAIAMFVRDLERDLGITIVRSVHIAPSHGGENAVVLANIETEHFAISPRAAVAEGGGS
jgi:Tfp pilus assembly protein PilO